VQLNTRYMTENMASSKGLTALKRFSSCDVLFPKPPQHDSQLIKLPQIGDALVKLKVPYGGYLHGIKMFSPLQQAGETKIFGPVYTVQMIEASNTTAPKTDKHFADGIEKDSVVFISQPKGMYSACWGGLMSTRAKYLGAQGVVIDGHFRDINEHRGMGFPVSSHIRSRPEVMR